MKKRRKQSVFTHRIPCLPLERQSHLLGEKHDGPPDRAADSKLFLYSYLYIFPYSMDIGYERHHCDTFPP